MNQQKPLSPAMQSRINRSTQLRQPPKTGGPARATETPPPPPKRGKSLFRRMLPYLISGGGTGIGLGIGISDFFI